MYPSKSNHKLIDGDADSKMACVSQVKSEDGAQYYQIQWCDKRGRSHTVWKRYSRFLDLRSELSDKVPPVSAVAILTTILTTGCR